MIRVKLPTNTTPATSDTEDLLRHIHLAIYGEFESRDLPYPAGAYVLRKKINDCPWFVFGWKFQGWHLYTPFDRLQELVSNLQAGLKDFPIGHSMMVRTTYMPDDSSVQAYLDRLYNKASCDALKFQIQAEKDTISELTRQGRRVTYQSNIFLKYNPEGEREKGDWIERAIESLEDYLPKQLRATITQDDEYWQRIASNANNAFLSFNSYLGEKLGFTVQPMRLSEMIDYATNIFDRDPTHRTLDPPQVLHYRNGRLNFKKKSETSAANLVIGSAEPPKTDRRWIFHHSTKTYSAVLTFLERPDEFDGEREMLDYLTRLLETPKFRHVEFVTEIRRSNMGMESIAVERIATQNLSRLENKGKRSETIAQLRAQEALEAQRDYVQGKVTFEVGTAIILHAETPQELDDLVRSATNLFQRPAIVAPEREVAGFVWMQTIPLYKGYLLVDGFANRTLSFQSSTVPGFLGLLATVNEANQGIELLDAKRKTPVWLNLLDYEGIHTLLIATTRSGKSVLVGRIFTYALAEGIPIVALDYPGADGRSTFTSFTEFLREIADYFDIRKQSLNLFDRPNLSGIADPALRKERYELSIGMVRQNLAILLLDDEDAGSKTLEAILLDLCVTAFYSDPEILARFEAAEAGGIGSQAWANSPTLVTFRDKLSYDYVRRVYSEQLDIDRAEIDRAITLLKLRLTGWIESDIGRAIARPSTVRTSALLLVFALTALKDRESKILAAIAFARASTTAMQYPRSIVFFDESPILLKHDAIARLVAALCSNGAKSGIHVIISAQSPSQIAQKESIRDDIIGNMAIKMIGRIEQAQKKSVVDILQLTESMANRCASYTIDAIRCRTSWLLSYNGRYTRVHATIPPWLLATLANNSHEAAIRKRFFNTHYPGNRYHSTVAFADLMSAAASSNMKMLALYNQRFADRYGELKVEDEQNLPGA